MISIITAVFNQLPMNELFFSYLKRYTSYPHEIIVIDNNSTDGSREFFVRNGATVIRNPGNFSYPYCQNQGIRAARYDNLVFLNNDLIVSPGWDKLALEIMGKHGLEVATGCATDRMESPEATYKSQKRWKYVRNPLLFLFGTSKINLRLMHFLQYGHWEKWNARRRNQFGDAIIEGIAGSNVFIKRSALEKIGMWDERIQGADFDIYLRTKTRHIQKGDIQPVHLMPSVYMHHYIRLTQKIPYPPFVDKPNLIRIQEKWEPSEVNPLLKDADMYLH